VEIYPGAGKALKRLAEAGFLVIMITNQSGVGRGYFTMADVQKVHEHIGGELAKEGGHLDKIYVAPETPDEPSRGRKPSPQFLFDARDEFGIELSSSYLVGDKWIDLECGWNAGVGECILVRTGYGREVEAERLPGLEKACILDDLSAAAEWILENAGGKA
jgi:histidinol-phosphate phosphatase family protein